MECFFVSPPAPDSHARSEAAVDAGDAAPAKAEEMQSDLVLSRFWKPPPSADCAGKSGMLRQKKTRHRPHSTHEGRLKLALKLHHRARLRCEDPLQMLHRLQHRFRLRALRWSQRPAQPGTHHRQPPAHPAHDGIRRLQRQRPGDRLRRPLQRQPGKPRHQQPPQPQSRHRVPRQNVGKEKRKRSPAPAPPAAPRTIRPLPALALAIGGIGIIARKQTVAVERAAPSAMRTRPALQRKSTSLNSPASRTKQNGARDI